MSEPTQEEKQRTIKLARQMFANLMDETVGHGAVEEYINNQRTIRANWDKFLGRKPPEPAEDPADRQRLLEVLAAARAARGEHQ